VVETINGTERLGWDQPAADAVELATIGYAIYVDGGRMPLAGASCASTSPSAVGFACSARLPTLPAGPHTLQLASFITDGAALESARSAALRVHVAPAVTRVPEAPGLSAATPLLIGTTGRVRMRIELVADELDHPTDLAFATDGRLFIAERSGHIRIVRGGRLLPHAAASLAEPSGSDGKLLALALDPQFERTRFVFAIYTAPSRSGAQMFCLARFREASDTLADRVVLLDGIPASSEPTASLRFGADAKLYAALDAGRDARGSDDRASPNGKILRLNADGTTPADQAGSTPIYSDGSRSPGGFDWDPRGGASGTIWIADRDAAGSSRLRAVGQDPGVAAGSKRGIVRGTYALPASTTPSSVAFYRGALFPAFAGSLLVASEDGRHLLRIALGDRSPMEASGGDGFTAVPVSTERLLHERVGGLGVVAVGPEGAIYFGTASAVGRLTPDRTLEPN
jgi:glucose/arabinose dehydrogenase